MKIAVVALGALLAAIANPVLAQQTRLPLIAPELYSEAQKQAAAGFEAMFKRPPYGPFEKLMYSPELVAPMYAMGNYPRRKTAVGPALSELAILVTAREWSQDYVWKSHAPFAVTVGIKQEIVDAIADGRRPAGMSADEEICYDFATELQHNKRVSDATFARAKERFGERGVVDLAAVTGYYAMVATVLNTARVTGAGERKLSRFPD